MPEVPDFLLEWFTFLTPEQAVELEEFLDACEVNQMRDPLVAMIVEKFPDLRDKYVL